MNTNAKSARWVTVAAFLAVMSSAGGALSASAATGVDVPPKVGTSQDILERPAQLSPRSTMGLYNGVAVAGKRLVAVGERGYVLLSDDEGKTWRQAKLVPSSVALTSVSFTSEKLGWAVGHSGVVLATKDGGESWTVQLDGKKAAEIEAAAADEDAAGAATPTKRQRNAQGLIADGPDKPFLSVRFFDDKRGLIVGAYGLAFETQDGGESWKSIMGRIDNPGSRHLYNIGFKNKEILIAGEQGLLLRSGNDGKTFSRVDVNYPGTFFGTLSFPDGGMLVYGLRGNAFRSGDDGKTWAKVDFELPVSLTAGVVLSDGRSVVVDETGRVLLSRDGGVQFNPLKMGKVNSATGVVETEGGGLVITTGRGPARVNPDVLRLEVK